jgi:hypothetical protein
MEEDEVVTGAIPLVPPRRFGFRQPERRFTVDITQPVGRDFARDLIQSRRDFDAALAETRPNSPERFQLRFREAQRVGVPMSRIKGRTESELAQEPEAQPTPILEYTPIALRALTPEAAAFAADDIAKAKMLDGAMRGFGAGGIRTAHYGRKVADANLREALYVPGAEPVDVFGLTIAPLTDEELTEAQIAQIILDYQQQTAKDLNLLEQFTNATTLFTTQATEQFTNTAWKTTLIGGGIGGGTGAISGALATPAPHPLAKAAGAVVGGTFGAAKGSFWGWRAGTALDSIGQSIGHAYGEYSAYVDQNGIPLDRETAQATAIAAGFLIGSIDFLALDKLVRMLPGGKNISPEQGIKKLINGLLETEAGRDALKNAGNKLRPIIMSGAVEMGAEVAQELIQIAGGELVAKNVTEQKFDYAPASEWWQRSYQAGTLAFFGAAGTRAGVSIGVAAPSRAIHSRIMDRSTRKTEAEINRLETAINQVASSGLTNKPEVTERIVNEAVNTDNERGSNTVTLTAEDLNQLAEDQDTDVITILEELNVDAEEARNTVDQNVDVQVPVGTFIANGARLRNTKPDLIDGLLSKARYIPDAMNRQEAAVWKKMRPSEKNKEVSNKAATGLKGAQKDRAKRLLQDRIQVELDAANRFGKGINKWYAKLTAQAYFRIAEREGISINMAFEETPLRIVAEPIIRNNMRDGYAQPIEDARNRGFEAQTEAEAIEFLDADAVGLDTSPEAAKQRAEDAGFNTEMPVYRGLSRTQNYVVDPKEGEGFQDVRTMRPEGKHRHISVTSNEKMVNDWIDRDQDTGKKRKDTDAGKATVFKMFMRGKLLDLMDKVQRARFREELMNVLVADERRYKNLIRDIADIFETLPDAMRQKMSKIAVEFAATRPEVDMSDIDATTTQGFRTLLTRMGSVKTQATVDNDNLPMVAQAMDAMHGELVRFQNSRAANNLTSNQMLGLIELTNTVLKLKDLSRGRELAIFGQYHTIYIGSSAQRLIDFDERMQALDKSDKKNKWEWIEPMSHYIEAAGYDIYKQSENGSDTYGVIRPENLRSVNAQFDPDRIDSDDLLAQQQRTAQDKKSKRKAPRGLYSPSTNTISLLKDANLTTFLHELGHHFLEVYTSRAMSLMETLRSGTKLTEGQRAMVQDINDLIYQLAEQTNQKVPDEFATPLDWFNSLSFDERVSMHEKYADMNEAYWMTGKPPTMSLWDMFRTFARWVTDWYGTIDKLDVELSPEVTSVMDRMLASQKEIEAAQERAGANPMFSEKPSLMTDEEWFRMQTMFAQATEESEQLLRKRTLKDLTWLRSARSKIIKSMQATAKAQRAAVQRQVESTLSELPVFQLLDFVKRGIVPEGFAYEGGFKIHIDDLKKVMGQNVDLSKFKYGRWGEITKDRTKAANLTLIANMFGFASPSAMLRQMMSAPDRKEYVQQQTDAIMLRDFSELQDPKKWEEAADEALATKMRRKFKLAELDALSKALTGKERDRLRSKFFTEDNKSVVRLVIGRLKNTQLNPKKFIQAAKRAGEKSERAMANDNLEQAVAAKRDQIFNMMIAEELYKEKQRRDKMLTTFKKVMSYKEKAGTRQYDIVTAARAILFSFGMNQNRAKTLKYLETIQSIDPELYETINSVVGAHLQARRPDGKPKTINDLTMDELTSLHEIVQSLWDQSLAANKFILNGKQLKKELVKNEIAGVLKGRGATLPPEGPITVAEEKRTLFSWVYSFSRIENFVRVIEGPIRGPLSKYLVEPIVTAAAKYRLETARVIQQYRDALKKVEGTLDTGPILAPELGPGVQFEGGKGQLLHAMLHTGNASNKRKMLLGRKWAEEVTRPPRKKEKGRKKTGEIDTSKWDAFVRRMEAEGVLTKADYEFLQSVWDIFESLKEPAQTVFRRLNGRYFLQETAQELKTAYGTFKGGYVPIEYDWDATMKIAPGEKERSAAEHQKSAIEKDALGSLGNQSFFPSKSPGFTEARSDFVGVVRLNLSSLHKHMDHQLRYIHMMEPVYHARQMIDDPEITALLKDIRPNAKAGLLKPWLERSATQQHYEKMVPWIDRGAVALRNVTSMMFMMFNIANSMLQLSGLTLAMVAINPRLIGESFVRITSQAAGNNDAIKFMEESSVYMLDRRTNFRIVAEQEIGRIIKPGKLGKGPVIDGARKARDWAERNTYIFQVYTQNFVDAVVWDAAYMQAKDPESKTDAKEFGTVMSDEDAIAYADATVRKTQGTVGPETATAAESMAPIVRLFLHFWSYMGTWANLLGERAKIIGRSDSPNKGLQFLHLYLMGYAIPSAVARVINNTIMGRWERADEDEDEKIEWNEIGMELVRGQIGDGLGMLPGVGIAIGAVLPEVISPRLSSRGIEYAPAISALNQSLQGFGRVFEDAINFDDEFDWAEAADVGGDIVSWAARIPADEVGNRLEYIIDVQQGDVTPTGMLDYLRSAVITGRPSEAARE